MLLVELVMGPCGVSDMEESYSKPGESEAAKTTINILSQKARRAKRRWSKWMGGPSRAWGLR